MVGEAQSITGNLYDNSNVGLVLHCFPLTNVDQVNSKVCMERLYSVLFSTL